jgi:hypothetical protein
VIGGRGGAHSRVRARFRAQQRAPAPNSGHPCPILGRAAQAQRCEGESEEAAWGLGAKGRGGEGGGRRKAPSHDHPHVPLGEPGVRLCALLKRLKVKERLPDAGVQPGGLALPARGLSKQRQHHLQRAAAAVTSG